jgi:amino acid transporter
MEPATPGLRRELGARDLTLFAIAGIIGVRWIASAAHAGSGSILLWLLAALFFLIPLSIAVAALTARDPGAGGMYLWSRRDFGPWHGFLCFWIYWMSTVIWFPSAAMFYSSAAVFTLGSRYAALANNRMYLVAASLLIIWIALGTNIVGMKIGKWTENLGAISTWTLGIMLAVVAFLIWKQRGSATHFHLLPDFNWGTVNFWASIAYGMTGMEVAGLMGAEMRNPARDLPRAAWIASVFTTLFYAGSTAALLVVLAPEKISDLNGLAQTGQAAGEILGASWLSSCLAALVLCSAIGQFGSLASGVARMPFAAGADHLLPEPFARIHPRWATPWISILTFGALASVLLIAVQLGDTAQAAYQTTVSLMVISGFLPFLYIFGSAWKAGNKLSAISGWAVTVLAIVCAVVPTSEVTRIWLFELKLALGTAAVILSALAVYRRQSRLTYPAYSATPRPSPPAFHN